MENIIKKSVFLLIITLFILVNISSAQPVENLKQPENLKEAEEMQKQIFEVGKRNLPEEIKRLWKEEVVPVWQTMYDWFERNIWIKIFKKEIQPRVEEEAERRGVIIEEEFEKEKKELKENIREELPQIQKSFWLRLLELWE
jgi:hypothetical protein